MTITEVQVRPPKGDMGPNVVAFATITFDGVFCVRSIRIISVKGRYMLSMPSRKLADGTFRDMCHPVNPEFRAYIEKAIFDELAKARPKEKGGQAA